MKPAKETSAVKLPFETGEYLITWQVPDRKGGHTSIGTAAPLGDSWGVRPRGSRPGS